MPYVKRSERTLIDYHMGEAVDWLGRQDFSVGALNYVVTIILQAYLGSRPTYAAFNDAIGVLECAKLELYRRMVAPYEDAKKAENGDVYPVTEAK